MIKRGTNKITEATFSVGLNVILTGSKKMSAEEQEQLMNVESVRVVISDASKSDSVLIDWVIDAKEFSTGSVGYGLNVRGVRFADV